MESGKSAKKGISLIVLGIVIIVMGALMGIVVVSTSGTVKETEAREFASEIKQLEYLAKQARNLNDDKDFDFIPRTLTVSSLTSEQKTQMSEEIGTGVTSITLYEIDYDAIDATAVKYGKKAGGDTTDVYLVSNTTGKVYYLKGFKWENKTHYTLTDELNSLLSI